LECSPSAVLNGTKCQEMEQKEKMKAARNEKSLVSVKSKVDFLDTEGNKSFWDGEK